MHFALQLFDRAIARDSLFAAPWAHQALVWTEMADGYVEGRVGYTRAREAASEALRRDSSQGLAFAILSQAAVALDRDPRQALAMAQRAVELSPTEAFAHNALASAFLLNGRHEEALAEGRRACAADSLSAVTAFLHLFTLWRTGHGDSLAGQLARRAAAFSPDDIRQWEGIIRLERGDAAGAAQRLAWQYYGGGFAGDAVRALVASGRRDAAGAVIDSMLGLSRQGYVNAYGLAASYAALGDADRAFAQLEGAWEQRTIWLVALTGDENFAPLRQDPRWAGFLRQIGQP